MTLHLTSFGLHAQKNLFIAALEMAGATLKPTSTTELGIFYRPYHPAEQTRYVNLFDAIVSTAGYRKTPLTTIRFVSCPPIQVVNWHNKALDRTIQLNVEDSLR
jgi:hypothetical protein